MSIPSLLNRSYFSFLNSTLSPEDIVEFAVRNNQRHAVISDFGNVHSWIEFYKAARKKSLIPVFSLQLNYKTSSILLIAKNKNGYRNLIKIASGAEIAKENLDGTILIHLEGDNLLDHDEKYFSNVESADGIYIRENKFLNKDDFEFFCALRAISNSSKVSQELLLNEHCANDYLEYDPQISKDSLLVKNVHKVLESCELYDILEHKESLNFFEDPAKELKLILEEKVKKIKFSNEKSRIVFSQRLNTELEVLVRKNFCSYFLVVYDAVKWAKSQGIYVGPGRGSVCGSLIAYILGITEIDPLKYDLYFERFLNPNRSTIPDIDIDVASNKRDLLFKYLKEKYGENHVSLISTFQTFQTKNSIREVASVFEIPDEEINFILRTVPNNENLDFSGSIDNFSVPLKNLLLNYPHVHKYITKIMGFPKSSSIHAAGLIISSNPLDSFVPTIKWDINISQWTSDELKDLGLVKFDFLSLQYLSSLQRIQERLEECTGTPIVWSSIGFEDQKVYETIIKGHTSFIFQFEHPKMKSLIKQFKPQSLLDLALISAIHRPGASDQIPTLLARKFSKDAVSTKNIFFNSLKDTYGLLVYQEQLMKLVSVATLCTFGESDTFRRDLSSKEEACKEWFFSKSLNNFSSQELTPLWEAISKFAKYGFNKSHAVAYAVISYRLMWLKTHFPEFFYSELLSFSSNENHLSEIQELGFSFSYPVYGKSDYSEFKLIDKCFYFPISRISGISRYFESCFPSIPFKAKNTLDAIKELIKFDVDVETIRLLIRAGYFNELFKEEETEYFWESNLEAIYESTIMTDENNQSIFDLFLKPVENNSTTIEQYKAYKKTLLGIDFYKLKINPEFFKKHTNIFPIHTLANAQNSTRKYIGFLSFCREGKTFKDVPFLWLKLSDSFYNSENLTYFGSNLAEIEEAVKKNYVAVVDIEKRQDFFIVQKIKIFKKDDR